MGSQNSYKVIELKIRKFLELMLNGYN